METMMEQFKGLQIIPFEEITKATNNFHKDNYLGGGGFGNVYKGELSGFKERGMVAFKRLDRQYGQGETEFLKEISTLSQYKHENLIALLGYCIKEREMILVYEYTAHGSLDFHLGSRDLTWTQRLKICLQAAEGLKYLHDPNGAHHKVIHRDIKSGNILLDEKWNAKVADVGLSKISPENANLVTVVRGTPGYTDPEYHETYMLTEHSDVYSFGVTLFEVLCGSLCYEITGEDKVRVFVRKWKESYQENRLEEITFKELDMKQIDPRSINFFADTAYQCLNKSGKERPTMAEVVSKLKAALQMQEDYYMILRHPLAKKYIEIVRTAVSPVNFRSIEELKERLYEGVLVNGGKMWFSISEKGEHYGMISIQDCLNQDDPSRDYSDQYSFEKKSRFEVGCYKTHLMEFKLHVRTPLFLSPDITYGLNLVFHYSEREKMKQQHVGVRYQLQGETKFSILRFADKRKDKQLRAELYQFTSNEEGIQDLEILLEDCGLLGDFYIEGIEFQPLERVEHPVVVTNEEIVRAAVPPLFYGFTEVSEVLLSQGILLNKGRTLFCLNDKGQHIERIFIEACLDPDQAGRAEHLYNLVNSRFPGGRCYQYLYQFKTRVRPEYLTPQISYTLNFVFQYQYKQGVKEYNPLRYKIHEEDEIKVFIVYPSTHMREDGWLVVPLYHFTSQHKTADLQFHFEHPIIRLLVAGIELQPSEEKVELPVFEEYQDIVEVASQSLFYTSLDELKQILSIGVHLNRYKTWFSINEKGERCHMISMEGCLIPNEDSTPRYVSHFLSRFPAGFYDTNYKGFKTHVKTQFLSPSVTYTVNLVYHRYSEGKQVHVDLKYRLRGETTTSVVYLADKRDDDYMYMAELYQFTSDGSIVDLEIIFETSGDSIKELEGIMFQPLETVEGHPESDPESDPAQNILYDYEEVLNLSKESLIWTSKKELYSILRSGFLINNGQKWFTVDKHGKKCPMLSPRATWVIDDNNSACKSSHESRFGEVLVITAGDKFELVNEIKPKVLSADTLYASYFVYKLPQDQSTFEYPLKVNTKNGYQRDVWFVYLVSPPGTPVIGPKFDENRYNPLNRHKLCALPKQRSDGWMEVKVWQFETKKTPETVSMHLKLEYPDEKDLSGLIIHGIELRPI